MPPIKTLATWCKSCRRTTVCLAGLLAATLRLAAQAPAIPDYAVGEAARADVFTPVTLVVFDASRTDDLRKIEAQNVPPIFRYLDGSAREAEGALRAAFANGRARFTGGLERLYGHATPLLSTELRQPEYGEFFKAFREQQPGFPLSMPLADLWALGDPGDVSLNQWVAMMRRFAGGLVREDALPAGERLTTDSVQLIAAAPDGGLSLDLVDRQGRSAARTNLLLLGRLRQELMHGAEPGEETAARFVAGFLRPNCFFDLELTRQARARRIESINAADRYEAGQRIVKQGEKIDTRAKLALDELRARTTNERLRAGTAIEQSKARAEAAAARRSEEEARRANRWLLTGLGGAAVLFVLIGIVWMRRRRELALVSLESSLAMSAREDWPEDESGWRARALAAEARAQKATAMLRANLLPHMARWMMGGLVQRLLSQRTELVTSQQRAEREVAELADRLSSVHALLQDRLKAYEKRVAELEAELAAKGEQNQELIKAKIQTTRKKLEGERSQELLDWN